MGKMNFDNIDSHDESALSRQQFLINKFKGMARNKFHHYINYSYNPDDFLNDVSKYGASYLPYEFSEVLLIYEFAPYFWISSSPILKLAEDGLTAFGKNTLSQSKDYKDVKNFFSKWALQKNDKEKQYFALSTINLIERNASTNNFLSFIYYAVVLTFDPRIYNINKALDQLNKSRQLLESSKLNDTLKNHFHYLLTIYTAFIFMKANNYDEALSHFSEAQKYKPGAITASFYTALIENKNGNEHRALEILGELVAFDKLRFQYAVDNQNLPLFDYFLRSAITYSILAQPEFANLCEELDYLIESTFVYEGLPMDSIEELLSKIGTLTFENIDATRVLNKIEFLTKIYEKYKNNPNVIILMLGGYLRESSKVLVDDIINLYNTTNKARLEEDLDVYNREINELRYKMNAAEQSINDVQTQLKNQLDDMINRTEIYYTETTQALEMKLEKLDTEKKYDSGKAMSNAVYYNILFSLIVFIIVGFAGTFMNNETNTEDFSSFIGTIMINGITWGGVAFVVGLIFSFFSVMNTGWEKVSEKKRLIKKISLMKTQKERDTEIIRKDIAAKKEYNEGRLRDKINDYKERIDKLVQEKAAKSGLLNQMAQDQINKYKDQLNRLIYG